MAVLPAELIRAQTLMTSLMRDVHHTMFATTERCRRFSFAASFLAASTVLTRWRTEIPRHAAIDKMSQPADAAQPAAPPPF